jgi:hypothetical protein
MVNPKTVVTSSCSIGPRLDHVRSTDATSRVGVVAYGSRDAVGPRASPVRAVDHLEVAQRAVRNRRPISVAHGLSFFGLSWLAADASRRKSSACAASPATFGACPIPLSIRGDSRAVVGVERRSALYTWPTPRTQIAVLAFVVCWKINVGVRKSAGVQKQTTQIGALYFPKEKAEAATQITQQPGAWCSIVRRGEHRRLLRHDLADLRPDRSDARFDH